MAACLYNNEETGIKFRKFLCWRGAAGTWRGQGMDRSRGNGVAFGVTPESVGPRAGINKGAWQKGPVTRPGMEKPSRVC